MECKTMYRYIDDVDEFVDNLIQKKLNFHYAFVKFESGDTSKSIVEIYFKTEVEQIIFNLTYEHDYSK